MNASITFDNSFDYDAVAMPKHRYSDRMSVVLNSIEFFIYEKLEVQKCPRTDISERWHPCSPLLMILSFLVTSVIVRIKEKRYA